MPGAGRVSTEVHALASCEDRIEALAWGAGDRLAAGSLSGEALVIDPAAGTTTALASHEMGTLAVAWSAGGVLATGGQDGCVRLWEGRPLGRLEGRGWCQALAWDPAGRHLAAAVGRSVAVVNARGEGGEWHDDLGATVSALEWTPDGQRVGAALYGGVLWFEPGRPEPVRTFDWKGSLLSLALAPNGTWMAAGSQEGSVQIRRLWSGSDLQMSGYAGKLTVLGWAADSSVLSVADGDSVSSWHFRGKGPAGTTPDTLGGHEDKVTAVAHHPLGKGLVTGCADGCVRFYSRTDQPHPERVVALGAEVSRLAWNPDGSAVASGCGDGRVALVEVR